MRRTIIAAACMLAACGPAQEADENEGLGEQTESLELPCVAYTSAQFVAAGNRIVCGTRPFAQTTRFTFTNQTGADVTVRLQSGPDVSYVTVAKWPGTLWWWHQYYGGFVRIEPTNGSLLVKLD